MTGVHGPDILIAMFKLSALLLALVTSGSAAPADSPRAAALEFTMALPEYFCTNSRQTLFWHGGSGDSYTVISTLHYSGYDVSDAKITTLVDHSSDKRYEVGIGRIGSEFPAGSTL